jgi:hypothetical protein
MMAPAVPVWRLGRGNRQHAANPTISVAPASAPSITTVQARARHEIAPASCIEHRGKQKCCLAGSPPLTTTAIPGQSSAAFPARILRLHAMQRQRPPEDSVRQPTAASQCFACARTRLRLRLPRRARPTKQSVCQSANALPGIGPMERFSFGETAGRLRRAGQQAVRPAV